MTHDEYLQLKESTAHGDLFFPFTYYNTIIPDHFSSFPLHWHDEFELIYVEEGEFELNLDFANILATKGNIIIIKPGQLHSFKQYEDSRTVYHSILFSPSMIGASVVDTCYVKYLAPLTKGEYTFPPLISPDMKGYDLLLSCIDDMCTSYTRKDPFYEFEIKSLLYSFMKFLFTYEVTHASNTPKRHLEPTSNLKSVINYINDNYDKQLTIKELSSIIPLNEHYFMKYFKSNIGVSCIEYITEVRMINAARLLNNNALTIKMVGEKVGISHPSYFNRLFKAYYGMTPKEYRIANYNSKTR